MSFKVICIDNYFNPFIEGTNIPAYYPEGWDVFIGGTYTVIEVVEVPKATLYIFKEREYRFRYNAAKFIPLSNINEMELQLTNSKELEKV